jgi:hypothetical protein
MPKTARGSAYAICLEHGWSNRVPGTSIWHLARIGYQVSGVVQVSGKRQ